jgi:hypothetical protein
MQSMNPVQGLFIPTPLLKNKTGQPDDVIVDFLSENARFESHINVNFSDGLIDIFKHGISLYMGNGELAPAGIPQVVGMKHTGGHGCLTVGDSFIVVPPLTFTRETETTTALGRQIYPYETVPYSCFARDFKDFMNGQYLLFMYFQDKDMGVVANYNADLPKIYEVLKADLVNNFIWQRLINAIGNASPGMRLLPKQRFVQAQSIVIENWWKDLMPSANGKSSPLTELGLDFHFILKGLSTWMGQFIIASDNLAVITRLTGNKKEPVKIESFNAMRSFISTLTALLESVGKSKLHAKGFVDSAMAHEVNCGQSMNITLNAETR